MVKGSDRVILEDVQHCPCQRESAATVATPLASGINPSSVPKFHTHA